MSEFIQQTDTLGATPLSASLLTRAGSVSATGVVHAGNVLLEGSTGEAGRGRRDAHVLAHDAPVVSPGSAEQPFLEVSGFGFRVWV